MADHIETIGFGETYTTIQGWENARDGILAGREIGELKDENFDEAPVIDGSTTTSDNYLWLRAQSGADFDHTDGTGARIISTGLSAKRIQVALLDDYTRFGGSEGSNSGAVGVKVATSSGYVQAVKPKSASGIELYQLSIFQLRSGLDAQAIGVYDDDAADALAVNCLIYDLADGGGTGDVYGFRSTTQSHLTCQHCTVHNVVGSDDAYAYVNLHVYNSYGGGVSGTGTVKAFGTTVGDNDADDDGTAPGEASLHNLAAADQFVSIVGGSENYHLDSASDLIGAASGTADVTFDIDGAISGDRYDIGGDEYAAAGGNRRRRALIVGAA